jgi:hypothetical protein
VSGEALLFVDSPVVVARWGLRNEPDAKLGRPLPLSAPATETLIAALTVAEQKRNVQTFVR